MSFEIHMYSAVARLETAEPYAVGQRHPMLMFVRQPEDSEHDLAAAAAIATKAGWVEVDITKAGTLPPDAGASMDGPIRAAYVSAVERGEGLMVFETAVRPAPRK
ncbi:MAG: hypothetical protein ACT4PZ_20930 [Panacagrimonas sp.]